MMRVRSVLTGVAGSPWYLNHYFEGTEDNTGANTCTTAVGAFWDVLDGLMANEVVITVENDVAVIDPATGDLTGTLNGGGFSQAGDSAASTLPIASQGLISYVTSTYIGGRRVRGRSYIPGLTVDNLEADGTPGSSTSTALVAAGAVLIAATPVYVIWSRKNGVAAPVVAASSPNYFAVMRSRRD